MYVAKGMNTLTEKRAINTDRRTERKQPRETEWERSGSVWREYPLQLGNSEYLALGSYHSNYLKFPVFDQPTDQM